MKNQDKINKMLQKADAALTGDCKIVKDGTVSDGYDSAIAAFGPTVVMSGLMPALAFYSAESKEGKTKSDKRKVIDAISLTLSEKYGKGHNALLKHCLANNSSKVIMDKLTEDIVNASVALKIMVRTYKIKPDHE
jgi:CRISPR-associated protein Cmr5